MNFFKSVFSNDPEGSPPSSPYKPRYDNQEEREEEEQEQQSPDDANAGANFSSLSSSGEWSFGGLMKTIASRSETVIQTYRRDLEEFGTGLKKETAAIREAASRAVRDLPGSLEAGASAAQGSLESVGQAIDDIISHGREALLAIDPSDPNPGDFHSDASSLNVSASSKRYSRFEAQLRAIQADPDTFAEAPEDAEEFEKWRAGFELAEKEEEIEVLLYENGAMEGLLEKLVPSVVDYETFWCRYYYRVYKLKQVEDARAILVKRVISREEEEEELSWEVDDDEEEEELPKEGKIEGKKEEGEEKEEERKEETEEKRAKEEEAVGTSESIEDNKPIEMSQVEKLEVPVATPTPEKEVQGIIEEVANVESKSGESTAKDDNEVPAEVEADDQVPLEAKVEPVESCKDSDISVVSSQPSMPEEDDLGWDEIEDLGEHDDKKAAATNVSPNRVDLRKRLSAAEEDEDLSWDIEDDDEPTKP